MRTCPHNGSHSVRSLARVLLLLLMSAYSGLAVSAESASDWVIDRSNGCRIWNQVPEENEAVLWSGGCRDGLAEGRGIVQWFHDGAATERYEGELRAGKPNGHGILTRRNGDHYDGDWRDGKADGAGQVELRSGYRYNGVWAAGCTRDDQNNVIAVGTNAGTCP